MTPIRGTPGDAAASPAATKSAPTMPALAIPRMLTPYESAAERNRGGRGREARPPLTHRAPAGSVAVLIVRKSGKRHGLRARHVALGTMTETPEPAERPILELVAVSMRFGTVEALRGIDLAVHAGDVIGLCGDHSAGKSTLVQIL